MFPAVNAAKTSGKQEILPQEAALGGWEGPRSPWPAEGRAVYPAWSRLLGPLWMAYRESPRLSAAVPPCPRVRWNVPGALLDGRSGHRPEEAFLSGRVGPQGGQGVLCPGGESRGEEPWRKAVIPIFFLISHLHPIHWQTLLALPSTA